MQNHNYVSLPIMSMAPNQGTPQRQMYKIKETTNLTRNANTKNVGFLVGNTNFLKEGSFSTTLCSNRKHSLNFMCHAHKYKL